MKKIAAIIAALCLLAGCMPKTVISPTYDFSQVQRIGIMAFESPWQTLQGTENLFAKHSSKPFNPKLAHVFFISGMIEAWGRGFDKIKAACNALYDTPIPEYDISDGGIMVLCKPNEKYLLLMRKDRLGIDESIMSRFRAEEASSVLQIMECVVANGSINNAEAREATGKSKSTITRLLAKMCTIGLIISEGSGPAVRYKKSVQFS